MPNTFKNAAQIVTVSLTDLYTCPSSTTAVIFQLQATNVTSIADAITMIWTDASNGNAVTRLTFQTSVPGNQAIGCLTGKLVLQVGDKIRAQCNTHQSIEVSCSILEMS